jgi:hypothetical protein
MKYRKLRIAWSVAWGVLCLLLIALWVRSYNWREQFIHIRSFDNVFITVGHESGAVFLLRGVQRNKKQLTFRDQWAVLQNDARADYRWSNSIRDGLWRIHAPHWLLILGCAGIATASWFRWRFSLRTLLVGMTLAAVALGLIFTLSR